MSDLRAESSQRSAGRAPITAAIIREQERIVSPPPRRARPRRHVEHLSPACKPAKSRMRDASTARRIDNVRENDSDVPIGAAAATRGDELEGVMRRMLSARCFFVVARAWRRGRP